MFSANSTKRQGAVTFAEALGATADGPLELNTTAAATCHRCGTEPRLFVHTSPKGREVVLWVPVDHVCRGGQK